MSVFKTDEDNEEIKESEENEKEDREKDFNEQRFEVWVMWSTKIMNNLRILHYNVAKH